jgi:hypothetical protein
MWQGRFRLSIVVTLLCALAACSSPPAAPPPAPPATAISANTVAATATVKAPPTIMPASTPTANAATPTETAALLPTVAPTETATPPQTAAPASAAAPLPALTPTAAGAPRSQSLPTPATTAPSIIFFTVAPTTTLTVGDNVTMAWEALGEEASLCFIDGTGPTGCEDVPLKGSQALTVTEEILSHVGVGLRASAGGSFTWSISDLHFQCPEKPWFFENPPSRCAEEPATYSRAAAQYFEHGFMVWTEKPDRFYVFFDKGQDSQWQEFIWWEAPYPFLTPQLADATPPPGLYVPDSGFGRIWRGELPSGTIDVRERLGWASGPEFAFDTAYQCEMPSHPQLWSCYFRDPDGAVLHLHPDSSAQVRFLWERQQNFPGF